MQSPQRANRKGDRDEDEGKAKAPKQMIDKLAARVLDFDLKYVERLLGAHHD